MKGFNRKVQAMVITFIPLTQDLFLRRNLLGKGGDNNAVVQF